MSMLPFYDSNALQRQMLDRLSADRLIDPPRPRTSLEIKLQVWREARAGRSHN